jgi:hypothetical protein
MPRDERSCVEPAPNIIPRFDLKCAKQLLQRGRCPSEVIAAAERLGADRLKHEIELYILKHLQQRELGIARRWGRALPPAAP